MKLTKEKLQEMYNTKTNEECCASLGVSKATFLKYVKEAGIPLKGKGYRRKIQIVSGGE